MDSDLEGFKLIQVCCDIEDVLGKETDMYAKYEIIPNSRVDLEIKSTGLVIYNV